MRTSVANLFKLLGVITLAIVMSSCAGMNNNTDQGTAIGAGVGAGLGAALGQAIGRDTEATLLGAGIGAMVGGVAGNQMGAYMDSQEMELRNAVARSEAASISRAQDVLIATLRGETYFHHNSTRLLPQGRREIERIGRILTKYQQTQIEVGGHTDSSGSERYNQRLSQDRAEVVKNALIQQGVHPSRIYTVGYGEHQPISSHAALNRRVEIAIIPMRG